MATIADGRSERILRKGEKREKMRPLVQWKSDVNYWAKWHSTGSPGKSLESGMKELVVRPSIIYRTFLQECYDLG